MVTEQFTEGVKSSFLLTGLLGGERLYKTWVLTISAVALFSCCLGIASQSRTIHGLVTDSAGNPMIGATVMISGTSLGAMTNAYGAFIISDIPMGSYTIEARMVGMLPETKELDLTSFDDPHVSFSLESGYSRGPQSIKIRI